MRTANKVLTLAELELLSAGDKVWVEDHSVAKWPDKTHVVSVSGKGIKSLDPVDGVPFAGWEVPGLFFGHSWRAWLRKPNKSELAANPWPTAEESA